MFLLITFLNLVSSDRGIFHKPSCPIDTSFIGFDSTYPYDVLHYNIQIDLNFPGNSLSSAFTEITAKTEDTLSVAVFNFVGLSIDSVLVNGAQASYNRTGSGANESLLVDLGGTLPVGDTFVVGVTYYGTPEEGIYYNTFNGGMTYVMSIPWPGTNLPVGARYWFPCYDAFNDKATSELTIQVPAEYEVVANGYLESVDTVGTDWIYHWVENYPIPTWYIVFSVSEYALVPDSFVYSDSVMPIIYYMTHAESTNALIAFSNVSDMLTFYSDTFGDRYPFFHEKYSIVRLPWLGWAMEHQTNVFIAASIPPNHNYEMLIAHETAHQWWACSITPGSTKDVWLNEGFATYCEALYSDHWTGGIPYHDYMVEVMDYYLVHENNPFGHPFSTYDPPEEGLWSATTYEKPASVLHMLRHIVGHSTFFEILKTYYATYKYGNVVSSEFQSVAETVSGEDLDWFFDEWIYKAGHPDYVYGWQWDSIGPNNFEVYLEIDQVQSHSWNVPTFKMPIDVKIYTTGDTARFVAWDSLDSQSFTFNVDSRPESLDIDPGDWILRTKLLGIEERAVYMKPKLQAHPNPFSLTTVISYHLPDLRHETKDQRPEESNVCGLKSMVSLKVYDITGRVVKILLNEEKEAGDYKVNWDAKGLTSGIYFVKLVALNYKETKKLILVR